jgi:hypothetical protein
MPHQHGDYNAKQQEWFCDYWMSQEEWSDIHNYAPPTLLQDEEIEQAVEEDDK